MTRVAGAAALTCQRCASRYPVVAGVPILLRPELQAGGVATSAKARWKRAEADLFDALPPGYDDALCSVSHDEAPHRSAFEAAIGGALAAVPAGGTVLNVGGVSLGRDGPAHTVALELSTRFLSAHGGPRLAGDLEELPLKDACIDLVLVAGVLHHLPDQAAALRDIARVLRPGGRALLLEPSKWSLALPYYLIKRAAYHVVGEAGLRKYLRYCGSPRESYVALGLVADVFSAPAFRLRVRKTTPLRLALVGAVTPGRAYYALQRSLERTRLTAWFGSYFVAEVTKL